jgi:transcriptional regulator with XRE-family HTH domain
MGKRQTIGERLKSLRKAAGMTQLDLAVASGLSLSLVAQIEQSKVADPRVSTLRSLASALRVTVGHLAGDKD